MQSQPDSETAGQPDGRTDFLEHRFSDGFNSVMVTDVLHQSSIGASDCKFIDYAVFCPGYTNLKTSNNAFTIITSGFSSALR